MKQIKKRFFLLLCLLLLMPQKVYASEKIVSDVAEQKSVIEEQQSFNAGIAVFLDNLDYKELEPASNPYGVLILQLTDEEKELIYKITFAESGNQCIEGQRAVVEVIFNRILSDQFPNTVEGVLSSPGQFSTWKLRNRISYNETQINVLNEVLENEPILNDSKYVYFSRSKQSYGNNYVQIQDHYFGRLK